jgi:hypothetical protein
MGRRPGGRGRCAHRPRRSRRARADIRDRLSHEQRDRFDVRARVTPRARVVERALASVAALRRPGISVAHGLVVAAGGSRPKVCTRTRSGRAPWCRGSARRRCRPTLRSRAQDRNVPTLEPQHGAARMLPEVEHGAAPIPPELSGVHTDQRQSTSPAAGPPTSVVCRSSGPVGHG